MTRLCWYSWRRRGSCGQDGGTVQLFDQEYTHSHLERKYQGSYSFKSELQSSDD